MAKHNINTVYSSQFQLVTTPIIKEAFFILKMQLRQLTHGIANLCCVIVNWETRKVAWNELHCLEWPADAFWRSCTAPMNLQNARLHLNDLIAGCRSDEIRRDKVNEPMNAGLEQQLVIYSLQKKKSLLQIFFVTGRMASLPMTQHLHLTLCIMCMHIEKRKTWINI